MKFTQLNLKPFINKALADINFYQTTKVQSLVIPKVIKGESLVVESATGSGKSHCFLIPMLQRVDIEKNEVQGVIIVPTRELANQLYQVALKLIIHQSNIDIRLFVGGNDRDAEIRRLQGSQPQIVIGTLGRLSDLSIKSNTLKIYQASLIVIDEADMVFDEKELVLVDQLMALFTSRPQFLVFSATLPKQLRHFINRYLNGVEEVILEEVGLTKKEIDHIMIPCKARQKTDCLRDLVKAIQPYLALVFVNKIEDIDMVASILIECGLKVGKLHGSLDSRERKQIIKRIENLEYQYVVVSDIASRGIDIQGVSHVINFDLPKDIEFYIHRTGRTGRYKSQGMAISLYDYDDEAYVNTLRNKGLSPRFLKLVDNALVPTKLNTYKKKLSKVEQVEQKLHQKVRLGKVVKPGYKKKRMEIINQELRKAKRSRIEAIYRKKAKEEKLLAESTVENKE